MGQSCSVNSTVASQKVPCLSPSQTKDLSVWILSILYDLVSSFRPKTSCLGRLETLNRSQVWTVTRKSEWRLVQCKFSPFVMCPFKIGPEDPYDTYGWMVKPSHLAKKSQVSLMLGSLTFLWPGSATQAGNFTQSAKTLLIIFSLQKEI